MTGKNLKEKKEVTGPESVQRLFSCCIAPVNAGNSNVKERKRENTRM